ncbi:MAG TPA: AMP-dependent synthetase [Acidimicrobiaceae bacterium]|nr:AMP-dependent synthetase [Acidimicrobiaceae bacterium]HCV34889.1 AMP-dependent synthetase [Acidimicrobiaceae bacterium]|tara:strand:+ start:6110 stop:7666 length:1557 start_codon:yes stop_codon:yes gene_type:complete
MKPQTGTPAGPESQLALGDRPFIQSVVNDAARKYLDRTALQLSSGTELTYRNLDLISDEVATGLAARGLREGGVILLALPSGLEYVISYVAAAKLGATTAGANPRLRPAERILLCEAVDPDLVLATKDSIPGLESREILSIEPTQDLTHLLSDLRQDLRPPPKVSYDPDRPTCICFTSGSTGDPKGAWFTDRQLAAIQQIEAGGAWGDGGHMVSGTAFSHVGFMTKLPWQLASGATIHILDRWSADALLDLIERYRLPAVNGVAAQIALLLGEPDFDERDLSSVRAVVVGAGPSPPTLVEEARRRFNAPYSIRYSSTESGGIGLSTALDADEEEALNTVGRPRPGVQAEIRDRDGRVAKDGEIGELWLRAPSVMSGYWRDPIGTAEVLKNGWLRTGDLAKVDNAGCVRLAGRIKEMYIRGGYNVYPLEVEAVLSTHPSVAQVAVVPRPDSTMGEVGIAVVVPTDPERPPDLSELIAHAGDYLSHYKLPSDLRIVDVLPLNAGDKVDRRSLVAHEAAKS